MDASCTKPTRDAASEVLPTIVAWTDFVSRSRSKQRVDDSRKSSRGRAFAVNDAAGVMHGTSVATNTGIAVLTD